MTGPLRVVIAGGSGTLGRALAAELAEQCHEVVVLTRSAQPQRPQPRREGRVGGVRFVQWDARTVGPWSAELTESDRPVAVVNLAGRLVDCRPSAANIAALRESRVEATRALVTASRRATTPVQHWLQASTTAIWSDAGEERITEATPLPRDGLPQMTGVARAWEEASVEANTDHRVVLRTSIVLQPDAPALDRLLWLVRLGGGGPVGTGRQWFSWIHLDDWLAIARACLGLTPDVEIPSGAVIAASDHPVRNAELMATLRRGSGRRVGLPAPAALTRMGAFVLGSDPALALTGRHCTSAVLAGLGWRFDYPLLADAVADLLGRDPRLSE